jgi:hypothetical protein
MPGADAAWVDCAFDNKISIPCYVQLERRRACFHFQAKNETRMQHPANLTLQ